jgi:hypothetical protein
MSSAWERTLIRAFACGTPSTRKPAIARFQADIFRKVDQRRTHPKKIAARNLGAAPRPTKRPKEVKPTSFYPYENRNALADVVQSTTRKAQLG